MALVVAISKGVIPAPQIVSEARVVAVSGNSLAVGFTLPQIRIDLTGISFKQRHGASGPEFSFDFGTLRIDLSQEIFISSSLTPCEQRKWTAHEIGHANDNRDLMDQLEAEFTPYGVIQDVFHNGTWYPRTDFALVQNLIQQDIGDAFRSLEAAAVAAHDTVAEYRRVAREILRDCPGPIHYRVNRGDTLSAIALHYYGTASRWNRIYEANRATIGPNPNVIRPGQTLVIPK
ncbi:MAG: LysM peptidoglycan-binding domain-containing protein [Planctomycetaceae bacterium]